MFIFNVVEKHYCIFEYPKKMTVSLTTPLNVLVRVLPILFVFCIGNQLSAQISYEVAYPDIYFDYPVEIQNSDDGSNRLFVVEQPGIIKVFLDNPNVQDNEVETFLDIRSKVSYNSGQEIGLLGLAFHPNFENNGFFYVYFTDRPSNYRMNLVRYKVDNTNPNVADLSSETPIFSFTKNQSNSNHNGGKIAFGPDGYLYISIGDGGGAGDPQRNSQSLNNVFGSIVRIDVDLDGNNNLAANGQYEIPSDNPRVGISGRDELYAWGIRNTWKFSFDGNLLYGADVGQGSYEEINIIENGGNYGWNRFEANSFYNSSINLVSSPDVKPIFSYGHSNGDVSITGGYVYRGPMTNSTLQGKYIYGDYITGRVWALDYNETTGQTTNEFLFRTNGQFISSFGLNEAREIYFSDYGENVQIYKITDENSEPTEIAVEGVGDWLNTGVLGINGIVETIVNDGSDNFYVGGEFTDASGVSVTNLARYNKSNGWEAFGGSVNGKVSAIALANNGDVYVGGDFSQIGGISASNIAIWNGSSWSSLGIGTDGPVAEIEIDINDNVYVGGSFITAGGITVNNIALWNGTWSALTDNINSIPGTNNEIRAIAFDESDNLYVGGNFDSAGGNSAARIATWDGATWGTLGDGTLGFVQSIIVTPQFIYAGGNFATAGDTTVNRVAKWNRTTSVWESLNLGLSGNVNSMAYDGTYLYAGGSFITASNTTNVNEIMNNIARWSESGGWEALGPETDVGVTTLVNDLEFSSDSSELIVGGNFTQAGQTAATNIGFWGENANCSNRTITQQYTINGNTQSGQNNLTITENSSLNLGIVENIFFTIQSPDNTSNNGVLEIPSLTFDDTGIYTITTTEGCTTTIELEVVEDPNGDDDSDGVINADDLCPDTPNGEMVDVDGCGESQKDDDNDGIFNNLDLCPDTPNGETVDVDGCSESQKDDDNDGVFNSEDLCPNTPNGESVDTDGCGQSQLDDDNDGVFNSEDLCPDTPNGETVDGNGCGESQLDDDNDGVFNNVDICPNTPINEVADNLGCGPSQQDIDNDGVVNQDDLCNGTPSGEVVDANGCSQSQLDNDNDGVFNTEDLCPDTPNGETVDASGCGQSQLDDDNDGVFNSEDLCPNTPNGESVDANGCSQSQQDIDNDGVSNADDLCPNTPSGEIVDANGCSQSQLDDDNDGVFNSEDLCPNTQNGESVDANGCSQSQLDDDNDGVFNTEDLCPNTPNGESVDADGCGQSQLDDDNDGVFNSEDLCPNTPNGESVDADGCSQSQIDQDNDGVINENDLCPNTPSGELVDSNGCAQSQLDSDNDGVFNVDDICPNTPPGEQVDADGCSQSELDEDNDGIQDSDDICPNTPFGDTADSNGCGQSQLDNDNDGVFNNADLCPNTPNGEAVDSNGCSQSQRDDDNDGVMNANDACPNTPNGESVDSNGCGQSQLDNDNDGVFNSEDICPNTPNGESVDSNGCGQSQLDDDNDGVFNTDDLCPNTPDGELTDLSGCSTSQLDSDNDGVSDADDICPNTAIGESVDTLGCSNSQQDIDNDGVPNSSDLCNDTPQGETVNSDGCSDSQLDDDNDGVSNAEDICPNTPQGVNVDFEGCELPPDDDEDGVPNDDDICPNTPSGALVDEDGCETFSLPATNFTISSVGNSCIGVFDGQILVEAERTLSYRVQLRSVSFAETQNFNNTILFGNLPAGIFELCITVNGVDNYESCYTVVVDAPTSLSVLSEVNDENGVLSLQMQGGTEYIVTINDQTFTTTSEEIKLNLNSGENKVIISTGMQCQGVFESTYVLIDSLLAYPNPFKDRLTIAKGNSSESEIFLELYDISGKLILRNRISQSESLIELNTQKLAPGFYILEVIQNGNRSNLKLIKQ